MIKKVQLFFVIVVFALFSSSGLIIGCTHPQETTTILPITNSVTARTIDGNGIIRLEMRSYSEPLSLDDINKIKSELQIELGEMLPSTSAPPKVHANPQIPNGRWIIAFGYAIYKNGQTSQYLGTSDAQISLSSDYSDAEKWFITELGTPRTAN